MTDDTIEIPLPEALCAYDHIPLRAVPAPWVKHNGVWYHADSCIEAAAIIQGMRTEERDYLTRSEWEARVTC